jgi:hypothetical protein
VLAAIVTALLTALAIWELRASAALGWRSTQLEQAGSA